TPARRDEPGPPCAEQYQRRSPPPTSSTPLATFRGVLVLGRQGGLDHFLREGVVASRMRVEIAEQPEALGRTFDALLPQVAELRALAGEARQVLFIARGSSDNAAVYGHYLLSARAGRLPSLASPPLATAHPPRPPPPPAHPPPRPPPPGRRPGLCRSPVRPHRGGRGPSRLGPPARRADGG